MKRIYQVAFVASALSFSAFAFAGASDQTASRAQVRAELIAAEQAGQYPQSDSHYPEAAQDLALKHVADRAAANSKDQALIDSAYGADGYGSAQSGAGRMHGDIGSEDQLGLGSVYKGS